MKKKLLFIYNAHSGKGLIKNNLSDIVDTFVKEGYEVTVYSTQAHGDATRKSLESAGDFDRIVCAGGDGTLDEVVTGVMEAHVGCPVGYIPAGSTNDFGNSLGLPTEMLDAARVSAGEHSFLCDVGRFGSDYFVYVAAFGAFTDVAYSTDQNLKNALGHTAYVLEGIKSLLDLKSYRMQVEYDGNVFYDEFIYGMVTNSKYVGGMDTLLPDDASLDDGLFEVTLIKTPKNPIELNEIVAFLTGFDHDTRFVYNFSTSMIKLTSMEEIAWTIDGEYGGRHESIVIQNLPKAIEIIA